MQTRIVKYNSEEYLKINKFRARDLFYRGKCILVLPANCSLAKGIYKPFLLHIRNFKDFDEFIDKYTEAFCTGERVGSYCAYYINLREVY